MMELASYSYVVIAVASVFILRWAWNTVNWLWIEPKKLEKRLREQGFAGNSYRFLMGDLKETSKLRKESLAKPIPFTHNYFPRIQPLLQQLISKNGAKCFTWMGPVPVIHISDPEQVRDAFTRIDDFRKPKLNPLTVILAPGLVSYEGEKWAKHRKLVNPAFHLEKLKLMLPAFRASIVETINKWETIVPEKGSSEVDVWPYFTSLTADVICRAAFGSSFEEGRSVFELLTEQKELLISLVKYVYIPGWKYFPTKGKKRMEEMNIQIQTLLKAIIGKRKKAMEAGEPVQDDLLGLLLDSNFRESQSQVEASKKQQVAMSFSELIDECKLFFLAGQETTSVLLVWTMILLAKHQDWQKRAREEVLATFGQNQPDYDGLNHLKTVTMIIYEVLRLYPSVVITTRRVYDKETKLGDLSVPTGAVVSLSMHHANRDPKAWGDDAEEFNPERFSEGVAKATKGTAAYFPFGWGPRICLGQNFAMIEAKMAISMILQRFAFELSSSYTHAPTSLIALEPQFGAHLIMHRL